MIANELQENSHSSYSGFKMPNALQQWRVNNRVLVRYRVISIKCSFLVIITHECVIVTKKLHEIPYDTVTHWNEVINTYLHRQLTWYF